MTAPTVYPLHWPQGFPRSRLREASRFRTSYDEALKNVARSLKLFAADSGKPVIEPVLSSNMNALSTKALDDPGVAVWFQWDTMQVCIPVDRYQTPAANLQAIHHIIEARRVELRHGTLSLVRASFQGFKALPAPTGQHWRDVLGLNGKHLTVDQINDAYRVMAATVHPDRPGGSTDAMAALNAARAAALAELVT